MKLTKVHLFVVLLLALVLCSFLGGACGGGLEGFNMPSDTHPYRGKGQDSDQFSSYGDMYSANKQFAKQQDAINDRMDKPLHSQDDMDDDSKYASFSTAGSANAGSANAGSANVGSANAGSANAGRANAGSANDGIPSSQILPGQEDLYILKSSVVPPVCPACPAVRCNNNNTNNKSTPEKCPPCPPCARCPEPSFECKKVPNYSFSNNNALPRPVLTSFSQFGL